MDREEECLCCSEIPQVANKNQEVVQYIKPTMPYSCITNNPGFGTVCLDRWVLQAAWYQFKQQYGNNAYEGPEHKIFSRPANSHDFVVCHTTFIWTLSSHLSSEP